jgi:serine/threonine-protein kinase SRPK3
MSHVSYSSHSAIITEDEKAWEDYIKGGYHPVHLFSDGKQYTVVRKLAWVSLFNRLVGEG